MLRFHSDFKINVLFLGLYKNKTGNYKLLTTPKGIEWSSVFSPVVKADRNSLVH